jgi:hypothetical protein
MHRINWYMSIESIEIVESSVIVESTEIIRWTNWSNWFNTVDSSETVLLIPSGKSSEKVNKLRETVPATERIRYLIQLKV